MVKYEQKRENKTVPKLSLEQRIQIAQEKEEELYNKKINEYAGKRYVTPEYMSSWVSNIVYCVRKAQLERN